ncbi:hypothetical protein [Desulfosporosinus sp. BG]|uniref:hypothetical protein n=1 Tax=Desulfosporosinus sp. BG TaxID=1633135 RepID=UPI000839F4CF|nr:hypothetical protein [Desulfosporosinus sp. BG]ODA39891.1 hypothetical protein DSBG_3349 [Desulfosporosinus sp. BG]
MAGIKEINGAQGAKRTIGIVGTIKAIGIVGTIRAIGIVGIVGTIETMETTGLGTIGALDGDLMAEFIITNPRTELL